MKELPPILVDDVYPCSEADGLILRRGTRLLLLSLGPSSTETLLASHPNLADTRIVTAVKTADRLWVFADRGGRAPIAFEAAMGKLVWLCPSVVKGEDRKAVAIQSWAAAPRGGGIILMLTGDGPSWPRPGHRPVYFWLNLRRGKAKELPVGWDPFYFSADMNIMVFNKPKEQRDGRRPLAGLNIETGEAVSRIPNQQSELLVMEHWPYKEDTRVLLFPGLFGRVVGVTTGGIPYSLAFSLSGADEPTAKARAGWAAIRVRRHGRGTVSCLWLTPLKEGVAPRHVAERVRDYEVLENGRCVFSTLGHGKKGRSSEVFCYEHKKNAAWYLLDAVKRLPELEPELARNDFVEDRMEVKLFGSFGNTSRESLALVQFHQYQHDRRFTYREIRTPAMERKDWRKDILVTANGRRFQVDGLDFALATDRIWLHNSGVWISPTYRWTDGPEGRRRSIELKRIVLSIRERSQNE